MSVQILVVDAFTSTPFGGNPAAVCVLEQAASESWMRDVAREMNLSETAFLHPAGDDYRLRWFTPAVEVALCGHATLASAHVLWHERSSAANDLLRFHTLSGLLTAERAGEWIKLDFPAAPPAPAEPPPGLLASLGIEQPRFVGRNAFDYIVEVASEDVVSSVTPDFALLAGVEARGTIVTARSSGSEYDFVSRFFAPAAGVLEDPVTGSAHCCLAPYWSGQLGRDEMVGHQISQRGGVVRVAARGDRVWLYGQAVTTLKAELLPRDPSA